MKTQQTTSEQVPACAGSVSRGTQWYHRVYDVLVRDLQAPECLRMSFVFAHTEASPCDEFRFQGNLGFGGKYRRKTNRVDCYHDDAAAGRLVLIKAANASLASLNSRGVPPARQESSTEGIKPMKNPDTTQGQPQVGTTALFAFLRGKMSDQKTKAAQKRREQRDADITASMHEEFSYVIDDIIDKVKALEEEWAAKMEKANDELSNAAPSAGAIDP